MGGSGLRRAFDEAFFGPARTLNLRAALPTAREAVERTERWLREQQVAHAGEVLVITGRGNNSPDGVSAVRAAVLQHLHSLRRRGVVKSWREHTAGSVIVVLAPVAALFEQAHRRREPRPRAASDPIGLAALSADTRAALRHLALRSLEALGMRSIPPSFLESEMLKQFSALVPALPDNGDREQALRAAIANALSELDR